MLSEKYCALNRNEMGAVEFVGINVLTANDHFLLSEALAPMLLLSGCAVLGYSDLGVPRRSGELIGWPFDFPHSRLRRQEIKPNQTIFTEYS